jgi:hypothetical protein
LALPVLHYDEAPAILCLRDFFDIADIIRMPNCSRLSTPFHKYGNQQAGFGGGKKPNGNKMETFSEMHPKSLAQEIGANDCK